MPPNFVTFDTDYWVLNEIPFPIGFDEQVIVFGFILIQILIIINIVVYKQGLDAAIGNINVLVDRFRYVEFTQPYITSGIEMVVTIEPDKLKEPWMFMKPFTQGMWLKLMLMHLFICSVVWLIENQHGQNPELKGLGVLLWFSVTTLFFVQSKSYLIM